MAKKSLTAFAWQGNPMDMLQHDWALLTAGDEKEANTMTVSWGGMGVLWNKPVCFAFVRPQRHTNHFMQSAEKFSLSFFEPGEETKKMLTFCGRESGRNVNKFEACSLTPEVIDGCVTVKEAKTTFVCKKLFVQRMEGEAFLFEELKEKNYPNGDYHFVYVGEIEQVLVEEEAE